MLTLYDLPHSPFCLPIKRALQALRVPFEIEDVPNWDRRKVIEASGGAFYGVPMLVADGKAIYESGADTQDVAQYVDRTFAAGKLFPAEWSGLQDILLTFLENQVEAATFRATDVFYLESIKDPVAHMMVLRHKERRFGRGCIEQWKARLPQIREEAAHFLGHFEVMLRQRPFLLGAAPVYADFLLWGVVANYTWNGWNEIPAALTALREWRGSMDTFEF